MRRKAPKNSLRGQDDIDVIGEDALRRFCGPVDEDQFKSFFGIDHATLVAGGKEIAAGGGNIAQILFSGGGVNELKSVLAALEQESEAIFTPSGKKRRLNEQLSSLAQAKKLVRDSQLPAAEWTEHRRLLDEASGRRRVAEAALQANSREKSRLERFARALPLIAELADLQAKLAEVADAPRLSPKFSERRTKAQSELQAAVRERDRAAEAIAASRERIAQLDIPQSLLAQRSAIEQIAGRLSIHCQARSDRPGLDAQVGQLEENMAKLCGSSARISTSPAPKHSKCRKRSGSEFASSAINMAAFRKTQSGAFRKLPKSTANSVTSGPSLPLCRAGTTRVD